MIKWILIDQAKVQTENIFTNSETYSVNGKIFKAKELEGIFYTNDYKKYDIGQITERELVTTFLEKSALNLTVEEYIKLFKSSVVAIKGIEEILSQLSNKFNLAALVNEGSEWAEYKFAGTGFGKYFLYFIVSGDLGVKKPAREFYEKALKIIGVNSEECLFIDDKEENCRGAEIIGIKSICFRNSDQLREALGLNYD